MTRLAPRPLLTAVSMAVVLTGVAYALWSVGFALAWAFDAVLGVKP